MRVLHCPTTVGGNPQGLARAERALGHDSESWTLTQNVYGYPADRVLSPSGARVSRALMRWRGMWALRRGGYDVVHFNFGQSFSPLRVPPAVYGKFAGVARLYNALWAGRWELADVRWAKRAGAVIAVTYQGDDARQGDVCRREYSTHFVHHVPANYYAPDTDSLKRERIALFDREADLIYALNPDLLRVLPARAEFLPYASVNPAEWTPVVPNVSRVPVIVHAPSHRAVKGTSFFLVALDRLRAEGVEFQLVLVENKSHAEARRLYEAADVAVDQLLAGFYGAFAVELMALGKPVICQLDCRDLEKLPAAMREDLPLIPADPESIARVLREWLTQRRSDLPARGRVSRAFVERWHDPAKIAARVIADYRRAIARRIEAKRV